MNNENPYYDLYVKETKAHNACALREQSLLKDVEFAGSEMERLERDNARLREACHVFLEARKHNGYGMDDAEVAIRSSLLPNV
jgi:hypothetical protein